MTTTFKTLDRRNKTKKTGVYFREIQKTTIDERGKLKTSIADKLYIIKFKDIDGKWRTKTIGKYSEGIREAYANTKRTMIINQIKLGEQPEIIQKKLKKQVTTLHDVFLLYKAHKATESKDIIKTEQKYKSNIFKKFGGVDINEVTTDKIVVFKKSLLDKGLANSTINSNISFIGTLFNFAIEDEIYLKVNPIKSKKLKALKLDNKREKYLTLDEVKKLYEAIAHDEVLTLFVKLSLNMGGRLETIYNIKKKDINLQDGTITLYDFKREMTYTSFISDELKKDLAEYTKDMIANSRVINTSSSRIIQRNLKKPLDRLFNEGLAINDRKNRAVPHTLRHTFASHLAINSIPIFTIKELMNHADIDMTMRYAKLSPNNGKVAIQGLYK